MKTLRYWYLLVLFLLAAGRGPARAQSFAWARIVRGAVDTTFAQPQASATDAAGNTYVAVSYKDSLRAGGVLLTGPRGYSQALLKYDATGAMLWAKALNYMFNVRLAVDNNAGGLFVVASVTAGVPTWDGVVVPVGSGTGTGTAFYGKCTAAGTLQWSNALPLPYYSINISADNSGNAYIGGTVSAVTSGAVVAGTMVAGNENYFLKVNGAGTPQWVRVLHGTGTYPMSLANVAAKPGGGCLVGGSTSNSALYLGTGTSTLLLFGRQGFDGFLTSLDAAGAHQWTQLIGTVGYTGQDYARPYALAADASGNSYVTGFTAGAVPIGGTIPSGFYLVKYDAAGVLQWVRSAQQNPGSAGTHLVVGNSGPTVMVQSYAGANALNIGTLALRSPNNVVHFNDQGVAQWAAADTWLNNSSATRSYFIPNGLGIDGQDNLYLMGRPSDVFNNFSVIQFGAQTTVGKGTIVARLNAYANTLRGIVYFDTNGNGQQDPGEGIFPRQLTATLTQGSTTTYSAVGNTGELQAYATPGAYTLALAQAPARYTITQPASGSYAGTFSGSNQLVSGQNFGIAPTPNLNDVRVTLTSYSFARPGFTNSYRVWVENLGTTTVSGTLTVVLDSRFTFISSTPSASRTGQTLTWNYTNLAPFGQLYYDVLGSTPTNTVAGTVISSTATAPLTGDVEPADNTSTLAQTVVASYDPNSIEVNYERLTPTQVAAQQPLDYTIHFQNLGTASAQNVILSDTLDFRKLNLSTLMLISQSHSCIWSLNSTGPNTGLLTVRFLGINLPERNVDVIRSQGFVRFRVQPRPTLAVGEIIPNHAGIVFDYNAPVITNVATTTVFLASAALARHDAPAWNAYPNPATDAVTLSADLPTAGPVRVELLDVLGRPVRQQLFTAPAGALHQALHLQGLSAGLYVLRFTPPAGPATSRQLVVD